MARFTNPSTSSGASSELNYVQVAGQQVTVTSGPSTIVSLDITTAGSPVQISVTGEGNNAEAATWVRINLFRDEIAIGNEIQVEASAVSENVPFAINFIDDVSAGTYNYSARVTSMSEGDWQFGEVAGPVINAVELSGGSGSANLEVPFTVKNSNGTDILRFEQGGTGVTRIDAIQDDLALRSSRDILLYPGDDGLGKVYIGWGDADYVSDATNEVATKGYVDDATGGAFTKNKYWYYPTEGAVTIQNRIDGESIALKSSDSAAIRWHVRDNGVSAAANLPLIPTSAEVVPGDGVYVVTFTFPEEDAVPTMAQHNYYVTAPNSTGFEGAFLPAGATTTTITFNYEVDPGVFDSNGAYIVQPSVYSQFEVDENGAHIKLANWTGGQGESYSQTWDFTKEGAIHFPYGPSNSRTGSGDVLRFAQSFDQAIITGPAATEDNPTANRLVIAGQDGAQGVSYDGEGGDVYVWAGVGGGTNGDGGDVKVDGGNAQGTGQAGYVKVRGGYSPNGNGGFVDISAGSSSMGSGGNISIAAGTNYSISEAAGGNVSIYGGGSADENAGGSIVLATYQNGKIVISGEGGEFLNDPSDSGNQIATIANVAELIPVDTAFTVAGGSLGTQPTFSSDPLFTGSYVKHGDSVTFRVNVEMTNITDFGTGQYYVDLPFVSKYGMLMRDGCLHDESTGNQWAISGHVAAGQSRLTLWFTSGTGQDEIFDHNSPITLNAADTFHVSGTYISA